MSDSNSDRTSEQSELSEQIVRDYETLETDADPQPSVEFYANRIIDYKERIQELMSTPTTNEDLYAEFFNKHINILHPFVKDMNLLEIRAYRERMSLIAKEAKAAVYATDQAEKEVLKSKGHSGPKGFTRSLNIDEASSDALNGIKERQKKLTKAEKIAEGLKKLYEDAGMSEAEANRTALAAMSAQTIITQVEKASDKTISVAPTDVNSNSNSNQSQTETRLINPFEKKKEE